MTLQKPSPSRKNALLAKTSLALGLAALLLLAGCQTAPTDDPIDSLNGRKGETDRRLSREATDDLASGKIEEALVLYAKLHEENPHNTAIALTYAQLLRKTGKAEQSAKVLTPFAFGKKDELRAGADPRVLNDLAASDIALGRFDPAEKLLNHVLEDQNAQSMHPDAYSLMGIVLDARGQHKEAEQMFHQALDGWKGDPAPVMNNLGLCLASQGLFDQALDTLRRALVLSPHDKPEIARNIQMISDLRASVVAKPIVVVHPVVTPSKKKHHKKTGCRCPAPADLKKAISKPAE